MNLDGILVVRCTCKEINNMKHTFTRRFNLSDLEGVSWYLRFQITCNISNGKIFLSQTFYKEKMLQRFRMNQANGPNTLRVLQMS